MKKETLIGTDEEEEILTDRNMKLSSEDMNTDGHRLYEDDGHW
jgi:hypothetical protein